VNNQEVLDNAPEGATHWDGAQYYRYHKDDWFSFHGFEWIDANTDDLYTACSIRSLADINRIAELEEELLEIRSDYQCRCTHRVCRICEQRKSIDKILAKGGAL
jgi:hypothetical protein